LAVLIQVRTSIGGSIIAVEQNETKSNIACAYPSKSKKKTRKKNLKDKKNKSLYGACNMPMLTLGMQQ
jgi:hypothetical protein